MQYLSKEKVYIHTVVESEEGSQDAGTEPEPGQGLPEWLAACGALDAKAGVKNCGGTEELHDRGACPEVFGADHWRGGAV